MNSEDETRCGCCGAALAERHVGKEACYCPDCRNFVAPLANGETPLLEKRASARRNPPRGLSTRTTESGEVEIREHVPRRWLWGFLICLVPVLAYAWALSRLSIRNGNMALAIFFPMSVGVLSCIRLANRRFTLGRDALVIDTLWFGFLRMGRRRLARRENTTVQTCKRRNAKGRRVSSAVVWKTGEEQKLVWRGRDESRANFILAVLDAHLGTAETGGPYLCARCGAAIPDENIDLAADRLTCPDCKAEETPVQAEFYRWGVYQAQEKFRPDGVEETENGFIYRENLWWNGEAKRALGVIVLVWSFVIMFGQLLEIINRFTDALEPYAMEAVIALVVLAAASIIYFVWRMAWGRFAVHRVTLEDGKGIYFCGVGERGRTVEFAYCRDTAFDVVLTNEYPISRPIAIAVIPGAFAEQSRQPPVAIFQRLSPAFYAWAAGRLTVAAAKIEPIG